jgi:hypothetical protein
MPLYLSFLATIATTDPGATADVAESDEAPEALTR